MILADTVILISDIKFEGFPLVVMVFDWQARFGCIDPFGNINQSFGSSDF